MGIKPSIIALLTFSLATLLLSCAQKVSLTGGPKDEVPPQLDTLKSPDNYVTNFEKQDIDLYFDEFVDLKDASKQIVISPPLQYSPLISSRLKRVRIGFDDKEELKSEATYVINFGKSIQDFTERNELPNFRYVFSTGDYIDSLSISGDVKDVLTGEPMEDVVVMLYIENRDSIIYDERPFYFARTDELGLFNVRNLRADSFKIVAIKDDDLNYLYNPRNEMIGFVDSLIILTKDSITGISIELWKESTKSTYLSYEALAKGKLSINFEGEVVPSDLIVFDSLNFYIEQSKKGSSPLILWYNPINISRISWIAETTRGLDTLRARINQRTTDTLAGSLTLSQWGFNKDIGLHPLEGLEFKSSRPIVNIDTTLISIKDTIDQRQILYSFDTTALPLTKLKINASWPQNKTVELKIFPGAFIDIFGKSHDTIIRYIPIGENTDFSQIELDFSNFDSSNYIIQITQDKNVIDEKIKTSMANKIRFERMVPGQYDLTIIVDDNNNGKWDPGNYLKHLQSERIYNVKLEDVREDWTLEFTLDLHQIKRDQAGVSRNKSREE